MGASTKVLLVRHGQSEWNALGRWQGQADPPLTGLGRLQARHAARALGAVDAVAASDLQRAAETAAIISGELGVGPVVLEPGLRERDAGEWSGLTRAEIHERWPGYLDAPADEHTGFGPAPADATPRRPPGWEPDEALRTRASAALARLHAAVGGGEVVAVTHGGVIYALEALLGASFAPVPNLGARWIVVGPDGPVALGERVVLVDHDELTVPREI
ncbi:MAG: histidine phosphatase family protein [Acidimicrobiia bacterium]